MTQQQPVDSLLFQDLSVCRRGARGEILTLYAALGCPYNHVRRDLYKSTLKNQGANYVWNFMMKYKHISFIFHSTFMCFVK